MPFLTTQQSSRETYSDPNNKESLEKCAFIICPRNNCDQPTALITGIESFGLNGRNLNIFGRLGEILKDLDSIRGFE